MKLLLDECLPRKIKREFVGHGVFTINEAGFKGLLNGKLIQSASEAGFEVLVSVDKNIENQQNKANLPVAILVLSAKSNRIESAFAFNRKGFGSFEKHQKRRDNYNTILNLEDKKIGYTRRKT